jgi:Domain of unknown function (DUF5047)
MFDMTRKFFDTLATDHVVVCKAELLVDGDVEVDLVEAGLVVDGAVQVANEPNQRTGSLELVDSTGTFSPTRPDDLLIPAGNEVRLWRGVQFNDGSGSELAPLGTFRFTASKANWPHISLDLYDRSWVVQGAKLESPFTVAVGTNYADAVRQLLALSYGPDLEVNFPTTDEVTASMVFDAEADPWEACQQLAGNLGMRLFFDQFGAATMQPEPDPANDTPVWVFDDADIKNLGLPGIGLDWDTTAVVNAVIAVGENTDNGAIYRGTAYDTDPTSPTQYGGRFGKRPLFIRDEKISSAVQATQRARRELLSQRGITQSITVPSMVNSAFECGDIVRAKNAKRDIDVIVVLDRFGIPLRASGAMQLERTRKVPAIT